MGGAALARLPRFNLLCDDCAGEELAAWQGRHAGLGVLRRYGTQSGWEPRSTDKLVVDPERVHGFRRALACAMLAHQPLEQAHAVCPVCAVSGSRACRALGLHGCLAHGCVGPSASQQASQQQQRAPLHVQLAAQLRSVRLQHCPDACTPAPAFTMATCSAWRLGRAWMSMSRAHASCTWSTSSAPGRSGQHGTRPSPPGTGCCSPCARGGPAVQCGRASWRSQGAGCAVAMSLSNAVHGRYCRGEGLRGCQAAGPYIVRCCMATRTSYPTAPCLPGRHLPGVSRL